VLKNAEFYFPDATTRLIFHLGSRLV